MGALNCGGDLTVNHSWKVDKALMLAHEVVKKGKDGSWGYCGGLAYDIDNEHQIRARCNESAQLNVGVKKSVANKFNIQFATMWDLKKPDFGLPAFGFKVAC